MKVLLISPKDPPQHQMTDLKYLVGGENTFTQNLLEHPPRGTSFVHYQDALRDKKISYLPLQNIYSTAMKVRILPLDSGIQAIKLNEKFDLIHCHTYCLYLRASFSLGVERRTPPRCKVVLSDSSSNYLFLRDYLCWSRTRIKLSYKLRQFICSRLNIYDPNLNLYHARKLIVWSNFAKEIHKDLGADPQKIIVIPPGIEKLQCKKMPHKRFNILFIGIWFERKGGQVLLEAYQLLKKRYPDITLTIVGQIPKDMALPEDVWHKDYLPREKLIKEIFPKSDILVLVPPVAEGFGVTVLEAASIGIPAIVSNIYALPEIVEDQKTGFVIPASNTGALVEKLETLIKNKLLLQKLGDQARERFEEKFWIKRTNEKLLEVYWEAMSNN